MIVSIESQNLSGKRKVLKHNYSEPGIPSLSLSNFLLHASDSIINKVFQLTVPNRINLIVYLLSVISFSVLLSRGSYIFTVIPVRDVNPRLIELPESHADLDKRRAIEGYHSRYFSSESVINYHVAEKDVLSSIAVKFGIRRETILSLNGLRDPGDIVPGMVVRIPRVDGVEYSVEKGDTLSGIAREYNIKEEDIFNINKLTSRVLNRGEILFLPGVLPDISDLRLNNHFLYPVSGIISRRFGEYLDPVTDLSSFYSGIDFVAGENSPVSAVKGGHVSDIGYNSFYGNYVTVNHSGGFQSLYGHMDKIYVENGEWVDQDAPLGEIGDTGFTSQEKLFFALYKAREAVNPEIYLK